MTRMWRLVPSRGRSFEVKCDEPQARKWAEEYAQAHYTSVRVRERLPNGLLVRGFVVPAPKPKKKIGTS